MAEKSKIQWTDATWSPVTGCTKVSAGCRNCYAEREVETRWSKNPRSVFFGRPFNDVRCHHEQLRQVIAIGKGRRVFVCPRADLFHEEVSFEFIAAVFGAMAVARQHTFLVLTKRAARMRAFFDWLDHEGGRVPGGTGPVSLCLTKLLIHGIDLPFNPPVYQHAIAWPLPNVHLGITVEDQAAADLRIPLLLDVPAAVRWLSMEPLLEAVDLELLDCMGAPYRRIDWVVVGGESGANARPMHPEWVRDLQAQCDYARVPFFFKQWGEWAHSGQLPGHARMFAVKRAEHMFSDGLKVERFGRRATDRLLDGCSYSGYPTER
jgi:protein gp37